jgi:hypothetical protein
MSHIKVNISVTFRLVQQRLVYLGQKSVCDVTRVTRRNNETKRTCCKHSPESSTLHQHAREHLGHHDALQAIASYVRQQRHSVA